MGIINLMDRKKEMRKTSLVLWATSLALLMHTQPLCAMDQPETREQKLEKARVKKQEMLRKIGEVSQPQLEGEPQKKVPHELGNIPKEETHLDKLKSFLQSKEFTNLNEDKADKYKKIVKSVESAKVSPEVKQALAKKLLNDTRSILNEGAKVEPDFDVLSEKINKLKLREEKKYREDREKKLEEARAKKQEMLFKIKIFSDRKEETDILDKDIPKVLKYSDPDNHMIYLSPYPTVGDGDCFFHAAFTEKGETLKDMSKKAAIMRENLCNIIQEGGYLNELKPLVYEYYMDLSVNNPNYNKLPDNLIGLLAQKEKCYSLYNYIKKHFGKADKLLINLQQEEELLAEDIKKAITLKNIKAWAKAQKIVWDTEMVENVGKNPGAFKDLVYDYYWNLTINNPNHKKLPKDIKAEILDKVAYASVYNYILNEITPQQSFEFKKLYPKAMSLTKEGIDPIESIRDLIEPSHIKAYMERFRKVGGGDSYIAPRPGMFCAADILAIQGGKRIRIFTFKRVWDKELSKYVMTDELQLYKDAGRKGDPIINILHKGVHYTRLYAQEGEKGQCDQILANYKEYNKLHKK